MRPSCDAVGGAHENGMPLTRDKPKWRNGRRDGLKNRWAARLMWVRLPPSAPLLGSRTWARSWIQVAPISLKRLKGEANANFGKVAAATGV